MKNQSTLGMATTLLAAVACVPGLAHAAEPNWWLHAGPVHVGFNTQATISAAGSVLPGADARASSNTALGLEVGYAVTDAVVVALTVGVPPTTRLVGRGGPPDGFELGRVKYAPAVFSAHYHFDLGSVRPYVGAGVNYTRVLKSKDGLVAQLDVKSAWGSVLQAGVDVPLSGRWGLFLDVKKIFLKTDASGVLPAFGGAPAQATIRLDPLLVHAGVSWRF